MVQVLMEWLLSQWFDQHFSNDLNAMQHNYTTKLFSKLVQLRYKCLASVTYPNIAGICIYIPASQSSTSIFAIWKLLLSVFHSLPITYKQSIIIFTFSVKLFQYYFWKGDILFDETAQRQKGACFVKNIAILLCLLSMLYLALWRISALDEA